MSKQHPPRRRHNEKTPPANAARTKPAEMLAQLEAIALRLAVRVSYENMAGELGGGGLCKVKGQWRVIVDKRAQTSDRVHILAAALSRLPLEGVELSDELEQLFSLARSVRQGFAAL